MKLISLKIKWFKNLDFWETPLDFTKSEWISIFIGNNGSWKSNVLEAISAIFYGLYFKETPDFDFEFELEYKKSETKILIKNQKNWDSQYLLAFYVDGEEKKSYKDYLPSQIIALYSWEETRLYERYYLDEYTKFTKSIINKKKFENINMIFISKEFWNIALLTISASDYSLSKIIWDYEIGELFFMLNKKNLDKFSNESQNEVTWFVKWLSEIPNIDSETLNIDFESFKNSPAFTTHKTLFELLSVAYLPNEKEYKLIKNFDLKLTSTNSENKFWSSCLSEGQKKQILIYFVTEILADKDSIILLDEPDAYIHVWNKKRLKEFFEKFLDDREREGEVIMTTHSPTLMNSFDEKHLFYLRDWNLLDENKLEILNEISWNTMTYTQQQILLNTDKDILIVEWKTDETYIKTALEKLKEDNSEYKELDFEFILLWGSDAEILQRFSEKFPPKNWQKIIAFFDRDQSWHDCITWFLDGKFDKETFKYQKKENIFISFYPKKIWFTKSNFEIEDYFNIEDITNFMYPDWVKSFEDTKKRFNKNEFANKCKDFSKEKFEWFKPLFDIILQIKREE